jgi:hypothetical protein
MLKMKIDNKYGHLAYYSMVIAVALNLIGSLSNKMFFEFLSISFYLTSLVLLIIELVAYYRVKKMNSSNSNNNKSENCSTDISMHDASGGSKKDIAIDCLHS